VNSSGSPAAAWAGSRSLAARGERAFAGSATTGGVLHHPAKAKRVVQFFMAGAASHLDLFDYKPSW
jgi:hypothetical protein